MNVHSIMSYTAPKQKQHKCPLTDKLINKMWYSHIIKYYLALKNEVLIHATTRTNLENIMLSKMSVTKDHKLYDSIYVRSPGQANSQTQTIDSCCLGQGLTEWRVTDNGQKVSFWGIKNALKLNYSHGYTTAEILKPLNYTHG